ncbi:MAG: hypothetical protein OMOMHJEC_03298 [Xanthomonadales bacterium]|nr:hypothetical protein [Xanthomonadales bacterium]
MEGVWSVSDSAKLINDQKEALAFLLRDMANRKGAPAFEERMRAQADLAQEVFRRLELMAARDALLKWIK